MNKGVTTVVVLIVVLLIGASLAAFIASWLMEVGGEVVEEKPGAATSTTSTSTITMYTTTTTTMTTTTTTIERVGGGRISPGTSSTTTTSSTSTTLKPPEEENITITSEDIIGALGFSESNYTQGKYIFTNNEQLSNLQGKSINISVNPGSYEPVLNDSTGQYQAELSSSDIEWNCPSRFGCGYYFENNEHMDIKTFGKASSLDVIGSFMFGLSMKFTEITVEFWIRTNDTQGKFMTNSDFDIGINNGKFYFSLKNNTITTQNNYTNNTWHHIAGVIGKPVEKKMLLYVDGELISSKDIGVSIQKEEPVTLAQNYEGAMDELYVYESALTGEQVKKRGLTGYQYNIYDRESVLNESEPFLVFDFDTPVKPAVISGEVMSIEEFLGVSSRENKLTTKTVVEIWNEEWLEDGDKLLIKTVDPNLNYIYRETTKSVNFE